MGSLYKTVKEPLFLLGDSEMAVIENQSIVGLAQGSYSAGGVNAVPFAQVLQDLLIVSLLAFGD